MPSADVRYLLARDGLYRVTGWELMGPDHEPL
jgi:hypothetical protein